MMLVGLLTWVLGNLLKIQSRRRHSPDARPGFMKAAARTNGIRPGASDYGFRWCDDEAGSASNWTQTRRATTQKI